MVAEGATESEDQYGIFFILNNKIYATMKENLYAGIFQIG